MGLLMCALGCGAAAGPPPRNAEVPDQDRPPRPGPPQPLLTGVRVYDPQIPGPPPAAEEQTVQDSPPLPATIQPAWDKLATAESTCGAAQRQRRQRLTKRASAAYVEARYEESIKLARQALAICRTRPQLMAWQIMAAAACYRKDLATASQAFAHLAGAKRALIIKVCQRNGVQLQ